MSKLRNLNREFISNLKTHELITEAKRNLILSILKSTTTNREARNYLNKYQNQFEFDLSFKNALKAKDDEGNSLNKRDNQRELFIQRYLNYQNPFLNIYADNEKIKKIPLRLALIKIKFPAITSEEWKGISETLKRLVNLGISPVILLDYDHLSDGTFKYNELYMINQVNKVMNHLGKPDDENGLKTTGLRSLFSRKDENTPPTINSLESILIPLYQGIIPIIQPVVYNTTSSFQEFISTNDLMYGLTSSLLQDTSNLLSIEKIINIDPIGGIPSIERNQTSHVFINLSQEYSDIVSELYIGYIPPTVRDLHVSNLASMNKILQLAYSKTGTDDTTGIITTPKVMSINDDQLNPIIYNILTDRPIISSSLPSSNTRTPQLSTSIVKKGIDVKIYDEATFPGTFTLQNLIDQKLVDKEKLVRLINDSFGKSLGVDKYFERVNNNLATLVIIGDYDGAAIITWEYSNHQKVAYLDKFAIARRNQGLPGMADIIFKIILQSHPFELIWRSRKNNPVNKWYFERCIGSMSTPESQWKIFYTGELFNKKIDKTKKKIIPDGTVGIRRKLTQYSDICESIPPSFP